MIKLDQAAISAVERGEHRLGYIDDVASVARGLQIPPVRLNFPEIRATVSASGIAGRKDVSWVDRRDFTEHAARLVLAIGGAAGLDLARLLALLPAAEPTGTRQVGEADVELIEQLTAAFVLQDYAHGSGLVRDAAVAQVHTVLPLLNAQIEPELRPR